MNVFDSLIPAMLGTMDGTMRYDAAWQRGEDDVVTARVFYRDEKGQAKLGDTKYGVDNWTVDYTDTDWPGLKSLVNRQTKQPISVTVRGVVLNFFAITADSVSDGAMVRLTLRMKAADASTGSGD